MVSSLDYKVYDAKLCFLKSSVFHFKTKICSVCLPIYGYRIFLFLTHSLFVFYLYYLSLFQHLSFVCRCRHSLSHSPASLSVSSLLLNRFLTLPPLPHSNCNLIRFALLVFSPSHATFTIPRLAAFGAAVADHCHARIFLPSFSAMYSSSGGDQHYRSSLLPPPPLSTPSCIVCNPFIQQPRQEK